MTTSPKEPTKSTTSSTSSTDKANEATTPTPLTTPEAKAEEIKSTDATVKAADSGTSKDEVKKDVAPTDAPPDPYSQGDRTVDTADAQASNAIVAEMDPNVNTDIGLRGYQIEQFDSSGENILSALAFPPEGAVRAEEAAKAASQATEESSTDIANAVAGRDEDADKK